MSFVRIRQSTPKDLPTLQAVYRRASWSNESDRALFAEHPEFLVFADAAVREGRTWSAVVEGRVVGFVTLLEAASTAEVEDLFVDPDYMRQGIGRALIETIARVAAERGWRQIEVDANPNAQEFYARTGFTAAGPAVLDHGVGVRMRRSTH